MALFKIIFLALQFVVWTKLTGESQTPEENTQVIYLREDDDCIFNFTDAVVDGSSKMFINMKLDSSNMFTLATVENGMTKIYTSPVILYVKNLTTHFLEFRSLPAHFDGAEIFFVVKHKSAVRTFNMVMRQSYRIKIASTPNITCSCEPNYHKRYHFCRCEILSRPLGNITVESSKKVSYRLRSQSHHNDFGYHTTYANVTIWGSTEDSEIDICVRYKNYLRTSSCFRFSASRFPRCLSDVLIYYILIPILLMMILPIFIFLLRLCVHFLSGNKKCYHFVQNTEFSDQRSKRGTTWLFGPMVVPKTKKATVKNTGTIFSEPSSDSSNDGVYREPEAEQPLLTSRV